MIACGGRSPVEVGRSAVILSHVITLINLKGDVSGSRISQYDHIHGRENDTRAGTWLTALSA